MSFLSVQIIFFLIVVDRIMYLCSFATGKVIFYLFNLILFTYAITEYAWHLETQNAAGLALRLIYLTKAGSLALQAMQIRYGVPHKSTLYRQFLTSEVSRVNYLGYRLYRALPFLYELRCVLDWSCTTTSLTMYDWLKVSSQRFQLLGSMHWKGTPFIAYDFCGSVEVRIFINDFCNRKCSSQLAKYYTGVSFDHGASLNFVCCHPKAS